MEVDYIIVGQGIAGTVLSYTLLQQGSSVMVIDSGSVLTSSAVAAGIFNPVTGKRLVKTWEADRIFPFLETFYRDMEHTLQANFFHPMPVYRPYTSIEEQNSWTAKTSSPDLMPYTETQVNNQAYAHIMHNPYGGILIKHAGYVDIPVMLNAYRQYLIDRRSYLQVPFDYQAVELPDKQVLWRGIKAKKILFCEGTHNTKNPYFHWLPFEQVKGELLIVHIPGMNIDHIINRGIFIVPLGNDLYKVGATYAWDDLTWETTEAARQEITDKLKELIKIPFTVTGHQAGIRPASADRRPFTGLHPEYPGFGIFNGLGTKGVSLAPYLAHRFVEYLDKGKELAREVHINRYFSLYYKSK
jgi:glycine/D-amino acid oxidase-like deaminating enzyme